MIGIKDQLAGPDRRCTKRLNKSGVGNDGARNGNRIAIKSSTYLSAQLDSRRRTKCRHASK